MGAENPNNKRLNRTNQLLQLFVRRITLAPVWRTQRFYALAAYIRWPATGD